MANKTDLKFFPASAIEGFRNSAMAQFSEADPDIIIRELTQNSLDASTGRDVTEIRIDIEDLKSGDIPAIESYRAHFESACDFHRAKGSLEQAIDLVHVIEESLEEQAELQVLWFSDNGAGLDHDNMERLFGDGAGDKSDAGNAGSFGVGHLTAFPASNLQYVLYGGVFDSPDAPGKSKRVVSGHAILATHQMENFEGGGYTESEREQYGKDGFLVEKINKGGDLLKKRFDFFTQKNKSPVISRKLDLIEDNFGTGAAVGILGFNRFNRFDTDDEVVRDIQRVIATHFTPIIHDGKMRVSIHVNKKLAGEVTSENLKDILEPEKGRLRRNRNSVGPAGKQVWDVCQTLANVEPEKISTSLGDVSVCFRQFDFDEEHAGTRVQLYRNGMWIEDSPPKNSPNQFSQRAAFNAVLLPDPRQCPEACDLIRASEGPKHTEVSMARVRDKGKKKKLNKFFEEIRDALLERASELEAEIIDTGFLTLDIHGDSARDETGRQSSPNRKKAGRSDRKKSSPGESTKASTKAEKFKRYGTELEARTLVVSRQGGFEARIKAGEQSNHVELRLILAAGTDETCDTPVPVEFLEIQEAVEFNGEALPEDGYIKEDDDRIRSIYLGKIEENSGELKVWIPCAFPQGTKVEVQLIKRSRNPNA
ncbi:MAG: hypothetical protein ISN29_10005 [Gammaproteobacteria bacterium AqS3]|nr:hypothetical protein [Gammaproteobacteria bacterium AqS3]